jgi:environmental stress-induced protein Ves
MSQVLDPAGVDPEPWENGAGSTRELAAVFGPEGRILWRVSVADLDHDACFSLFPGLDRLFVALGPLSLTVAGQPRRMSAGDVARFAGEAAAGVQLDRPTRALNVMTCRGAVRGDVGIRERSVPAAAGVQLSVDIGGRVADVLLTPQG